MVIKRAQLADLLKQEKKCAFHMVNRKRYQWGNKSGKWLARAIREKKCSFIPKIKNHQGEMVHSSPEIVEVFHEYYSSLYNVKQREAWREGSIYEYLRGLDLPMVHKEELEQLEAPITPEE